MNIAYVLYCIYPCTYVYTYDKKRSILNPSSYSTRTVCTYVCTKRTEWWARIMQLSSLLQYMKQHLHLKSTYNTIHMKCKYACNVQHIYYIGKTYSYVHIYVTVCYLVTHSQHKHSCASHAHPTWGPTLQCSTPHPVECLQHLCGSKVELVQDDPVALSHRFHQHTYRSGAVAW